MKGDPVDPKYLRYPLYVLPKFNGFRGYIKDGVVYTASNKPFKNRAMQEAFGKCGVGRGVRRDAEPDSEHPAHAV